MKKTKKFKFLILSLIGVFCTCFCLQLNFVKNKKSASYVEAESYTPGVAYIDGITRDTIDAVHEGRARAYFNHSLYDAQTGLFDSNVLRQLIQYTSYGLCSFDDFYNYDGYVGILPF